MMGVACILTATKEVTPLLFDTIVIGGGSAGLMAGIAASKHGSKVLLVDKGRKLGRKLGISGGGRCNVTNNKEIEEFVKYVPGNGRFLYSALSTFGHKDIIAFFEHLGIRLKEEDHGRMFPVTDKAKTVVDALVNQVRKQGVEIRTDCEVERVLYRGGRVAGIRLKSGEDIPCHAAVVAVGGKSVPHTGSTGDGYAWAAEAGHTITELYPTEVPITSAEPWIRDKTLQGISLRDIALSVWGPNGKRVVSHEGDMIFTHFGISGPAALRCSQFVVKLRRSSGGQDVLMTIDLFPSLSPEEFGRQLSAIMGDEPKKAVKNALRSLMPEKLLLFLLERAGIAADAPCDRLPRAAAASFADLCKRFGMKASGTLSIEEAFVTGGGVHVKEIHPKTMESRLMGGLYFCGEILDVHGYTGGYNITAAFSTGYTAGMHAAAYTAAAAAGDR